MNNQITITQIWMLSPELSVVVLGMVVLGLDLLTKRRTLTAAVAIGGLVVPTFLTLSLAFDWFGTHPPTAFFGMLVVDPFAIFFKFLFLVIAFGVMLASVGYVEKYLRATIGEYFAIMLFSLAGMMLMASTRELISLYISLELTSIPLYILAGLSRTDTRSAEASVKYVLLGAMSSAILLYGMALLYGATGSTDLGEIYVAATQVLAHGNLLLLASDALIFTGFGFKVSAVPFHMWAPDIYEGAPTPSTLFFSVGSKAAGFAALLRVFVVGGLSTSTSSYVWIMVAIVAALTMTIGNVVALLQTNIKRMMAYSSIGQAGYLLVGLAAVMIHNNSFADLGMLAFLAVYVVTNIGVFAGIIALANATGKENIRDFDGFGRRSPFIAFGMALCLLSLSGVPPMAGFWSKLLILLGAWQQGSALTWLVVLGLIKSAISIVYYVNVIWRMYAVEPVKRDRLATAPAITVTMALAVVGILALTVAFGALLTHINAGATSIFTFVR
jgi:NADH-quinone oxidoreductase subunit N